MTTRIAFERPPALVAIGEGITLAARYWRSTADRWVLPVVAVALVSGLSAWLFPASITDQETLSRLMRASVNGTPLDAAEFPRLVAGPLAVAIVTLAAGWFLTANAVAGLRARDITLSWVVASGLRSFAANLLIGTLAVVLAVGPLALGLPGLLVELVAVPVLVYLLLRLSFWTYALFDGHDIAAGAATSWAATRRSVLRVLGWSLALIPITIALTILNVGIDATLGDAARPVAEAVSAGAGAAVTSFTVIVLAVLYESQRSRLLAPAVVAPAPRSPLDPPPPPPGW